MTKTKITSLEHLREIASGEEIELIFSNGAIQTSNTIQFNKHTNLWYMYRSVDGRMMDYTDQQLSDETGIPQAVEAGRIYVEC